MRTWMRSKVTLLFMTFGLLLAIPAIALADEIANNVDDTIENQRETVNLDSHGKSTTLEIYVNPVTETGSGSDAGCNFDAATETLKLRVFKQTDLNNALSSVVWDEPGATTTTTQNDTITFTGCDDPATTGTIENSKTVKITSANVSPTPPNTFDADIDFAVVSNTTGGSFTTQTGRFTVKVAKDVTAPETTIDSGPSGTVNSSSATFTFSSSEPNSTFETRLDNGTWEANGTATSKTYNDLSNAEHTFDVRATDAAGNTDASPASRTWTVQTDSTPPVITNNVTGTLGDNGWYTSNVSVDWTVVDNESAISSQSGCDDFSVTSDQNPVEYTCTATSAGGTSSNSVTIKRDASAPNAPTATTNPANPVANSGGFFRDTVTVSYGGSTDVGPSGIAGYSPPNQTFNTTGTHNYSGKATDNAGNESTATTGSVKVDATDPTVGISGCPSSPVLLNSTQSINVAASDQVNGSGLVSDPSGSVSLNTSSVGSKSKTITVDDKVGHSASATCNYSVIFDWSGFFRPVDNPDVVNSAKAGSTIPVKFSLGGDQGMSIFWLEPNQTTSIYPNSGKLTFDQVTGDPVDALEEYSTATVSGLKYDSTANQYIYNWKTDKNWAGTYRQLIIRLADGTYHRANFYFTK